MKKNYSLTGLLLLAGIFCMSAYSYASLPTSGTLSISITHTNTDCLLKNGTATANVTGGTGNYTYSWSDGQSTQTATGLGASTYTIFVMDDNSNNGYGEIYISLIDAPVINVVINNNVLCYGQKNGKATGYVTGGVPPYSYKWCEGATTDYCIDLRADDHYLDVTDSTGCKSRKWLLITEPPLLTSNMTVTDVSTCASSDGSIFVTSSGGSPSYTYEWNTGATTNLITGLSIGTYTITITDSLGCKNIQTPAISCNSGIHDISGEMGIINFPNPTNGRLVVDIKKGSSLSANYTLSIYNLMGEKIFNNNFSSGKSEIDISKYSNGMYFLELRNGKEAITRKLILEK